MRQLLVRGLARLRFWSLLPVMMVVLGCDRSAELVEQTTAGHRAGGRLVSSPISPRATLEECIEAYQRINSYEDRAYVLLRYRMDGQEHTDRAPLSVAWQGDAQRCTNLALKVYSVSAGPDDGRWRLQIDSKSEQSRLVPNQIISRAIPKQIDFPWLLDDPMVAQGLAAGPAGFPPQLDLLLNASPMSGLVDDAAMLSFDAQQTIDGHACHVIVVTRGPAQYKFYIDQATMLLRRMRLPDATLPPQMLADRRISEAEFAIEFEDVKTGSSIDWKWFEVPTTPDSLLVNHFVPMPTRIETEGLGRRIPAFTLDDTSGRAVYNSTQDSRAATVMMWLADHPGCEVAARQLSEAAQAINADPEIGPQVQFIPIWAEPNPPAGETFETLAAHLGFPSGLAWDREAMGRDLFNVLEAPTMIVLDQENRIQLRESRTNPLLGQVLPSLLKRLVGGEDLADTQVAQALSAEARYETDLQVASSIEMPPPTRHAAMASYLPALASLRKVETLDHSEEICAVAEDVDGGLWVLDVAGSLTRYSTTERGAKPKRLQTPWRPSTHARILAAPDGQHVVLAHTRSSVVEMFSTATRQNRTVELGGQDYPVDLKWLMPNGSMHPRLALITSGGNTVLLDPRNREQMSGRCPAAPRALISLAAADSSVGGYVVLANHAIEPIQLSDDSALNNVPLLGRPAAYSRTDRSTSENRLSFEPAQGPWMEWGSGQERLILARGWLARDEAALFLLDATLSPLWHSRIGLQTDDAALPNYSVAKDPATGLATWVVSDGSGTVHILRADGLTDHMRFDAPSVGLALVTEGDRLRLSVIHSQSIETYDLQWR